MRLRHILGLLLALTGAPASAQMLLSGTVPVPVDQFQAALNATPCTPCWTDLGAAVGTAPTVNSVVWACAATPCPSAPATADTAATLFENSGPTCIFACWAGGALDSDHEQLVIWGGGHQGYGGNELYAFKLSTLTWSRLSVPSDISAWLAGGGVTQVLPDGQPAASHTYDGQTYVPGVGLFSIGECGVNTGGCSGDSFKVNLATLNPTQFNSWTAITSWSPGPALVDQMAHYDSSSNAIYATTASASLWKLASPFNGTWTCLGTCTDQTLSFHQTAALRPGVEMVAAGGNGDNVGGNAGLKVWSLSTGNLSHSGWLGDSTIPNANAPGFVWDSHAGKYVGWNGGTTVYLLDPATWTFTAHTVSGSNTVTPLCVGTVGTVCDSNGQALDGTFGRFQYDAAHNAFVVVNSTTSHVYALKPDF